jgi:hypothetical protein
MLVQHHRLAIAGVITAICHAFPARALAAMHRHHGKSMGLHHGETSRHGGVFAALLAAIGGAAGVAAGAAAIYAPHKHWSTVVPPKPGPGGIGAALVIGALAGLLPAIRAARLSPTQARWIL